MRQRQIIDFIDRWLDENSRNTDARVQDFALDVRIMVDQIDEEETRDPIGARAA